MCGCVCLHTYIDFNESVTLIAFYTIAIFVMISFSLKININIPNCESEVCSQDPNASVLIVIMFSRNNTRPILNDFGNVTC